MSIPFNVTLTVEAHGQTITLTNNNSSGDNPRFVYQDIRMTLADFEERLNGIVPCMVGVEQK